MRAIYLMLLVVILSCKSEIRMSQKEDAFKPVFTAGPPTMVYKTKADYSNLVPVSLSEDKTKIVSYPHPTDLKAGDKLSTPTQLNKGYLLDNRGIGNNVAFLKMTYEEYSKLAAAPSLDELYDSIIDKDPLKELCHCGNRNVYKEVVAELNRAIDTGSLKKRCKILK